MAAIMTTVVVLKVFFGTTYNISTTNYHDINECRANMTPHLNVLLPDKDGYERHETKDRLIASKGTWNGSSVFVIDCRVVFQPINAP